MSKPVNPNPRDDPTSGLAGLRAPEQPLQAIELRPRGVGIVGGGAVAANLGVEVAGEPGRIGSVPHRSAGHGPPAAAQHEEPALAGQGRELAAVELLEGHLGGAVAVFEGDPARVDGDGRALPGCRPANRGGPVSSNDAPRGVTRVSSGCGARGSRRRRRWDRGGPCLRSTRGEVPRPPSTPSAGGGRRRPDHPRGESSRSRADSALRRGGRISGSSLSPW